MNARTSHLTARRVPVVLGVAMFAGIALQPPATAAAAGDPADGCEQGKAKSSGKYAQCIAGVNAKAIKDSLSPADAEKLTKCSDKIGGSFTKAEEKAAGACRTDGDTVTIRGALDDCVNGVVTSLGGLPGPGGDEAKCQSAKVKESGKYAACRFKALAKGIKDGVSPDFTKCNDKLSSKWTKIEEKPCSTTGDGATVKAAIDACYDIVAGNLHPTIEYQQNFESLVQTSGTALSDDGWLVYATVFGPDWSYWYGYGAYPAPNGGPAFSGIDIGQGGPEQGSQQLVVYNDYNNGNHGDGSNAHIEANVYRERTIVAGDVGRTLIFEVDAKRGNINDPSGSSTAVTFIKTLDPGSGYAMTNFVTYNTTGLPATWSGFSIELDIGATLVGQVLQFGFSTTASNYEPSANFYDNIVASTVPTP